MKRNSVKTFVEWEHEIQEELLRRITMPQIRDFAGFLADLNASGISISDDYVDPFRLEPTQLDIHQEYVDSLLRSGDWIIFPIIISLDDKIVDGHHRWAASKEAQSLISVRKIDLDFIDLLEFVKDKKYIRHSE